MSFVVSGIRKIFIHKFKRKKEEIIKEFDLDEIWSDAGF